MRGRFFIAGAYLAVAMLCTSCSNDYRPVRMNCDVRAIEAHPDSNGTTVYFMDGSDNVSGVGRLPLGAKLRLEGRDGKVLDIR